MSKRLISLLLALLMLLTAAGCGAQPAPEEDTAPQPDVTAKLTEGTEPADDTAAESSAYLRLYCPADLSEKNKSAGGGDAVNGIPISWKQVRGDDRGRQQQAQYIMELLLGGCTDKDFICPVPEGTTVNSCTVTGGTVSVAASVFSATVGEVSGVLADSGEPQAARSRTARKSASRLRGFLIGVLLSDG